jgi:thioredoxin-like negative regulator of GroEL
MPSRTGLLILLLRSTHALFEASRGSAGGVVEVDAESWAATVAQSTKPAFVMWYSPTCPHCRRVGPHYAACAEHHPGPRYFRVDVDENEALADEHSVASLPRFQLFREGELAATFQGRPDEAALLSWVRSEAPAFAVRDL